ncbi:MAG TPA: alpha/beta hydrolase [Actinomycetota bacterium]|jgi:pimeloyl-ACP methyl ester carboxylesterase|nr:alpha/beta hydrolase [Actinomycetota bacterium]
MKTISLTHGRITLALHPLKEGDGRPLLHLHGLGLRSPDVLPDDLSSWPGPVYALDFTGHGASTIPTGGGYTPEVLMGDVDAAIQHLGEVTLIGRGLGAYIALLAAGGRPDAVRGAILCDGPGIAGGGPSPGTPQVARVDPDAPSPPDPWALAELSKDVRPPDYAVDFAQLASTNAHNPFAIVAKARPDWLTAVAEEVGATPTTLEEALRSYSR